MRIFILIFFFSQCLLFACKKPGATMGQRETSETKQNDFKSNYIDSLKRSLATLDSKIQVIESKGERPDLIQERNRINDSLGVAYSHAEKLRLTNRRTKINMKIVEIDQGSDVLSMRKQRAALNKTINNYEQ